MADFILFSTHDLIFIGNSILLQSKLRKIILYRISLIISESIIYASILITPHLLRLHLMYLHEEHRYDQQHQKKYGPSRSGFRSGFKLDHWQKPDTRVNWGSAVRVIKDKAALRQMFSDGLCNVFGSTDEDVPFLSSFTLESINPRHLAGLDNEMLCTEATNMTRVTAIRHNSMY